MTRLYRKKSSYSSFMLIASQKCQKKPKKKNSDVAAQIIFKSVNILKSVGFNMCKKEGCHAKFLCFQSK